jgi:acyl dehydratase
MFKSAFLGLAQQSVPRAYQSPATVPDSTELAEVTGNIYRLNYTLLIFPPLLIEEKSMAVKIVPKEEMVNAIGSKFEPGAWIEVTQDRINTFADCTEDHQFIHVDPEAAANTPFGGTIAHGFLTLSLLSKLVEGQGIIPENTVMGLNYGFDKVRFLAPVKSGKRVRLVAEILDVTEKPGNRFLIKQGCTIEIEGEETPALVAEWLSMVVAG